MIEYVTVSDVDTALGPDWADGADKDAAAYQANAYLNAYQFKAWTDQPEAVTRAGVELARESAAGRLYADSTAAVKRKRVKADTVESETEYQDGSAPRSGALKFVDSLLTPWIARRSTVQILKRL